MQLELKLATRARNWSDVARAAHLSAGNSAGGSRLTVNAAPACHRAAQLLSLSARALWRSERPKQRQTRMIQRRRYADKPAFRNGLHFILAPQCRHQAVIILAGARTQPAQQQAHNSELSGPFLVKQALSRRYLWRAPVQCGAFMLFARAPEAANL